MKFLIFNDIATLIREAREKKKWSQSELAALMGLKKGCGQMVSNVERGLCNLPPRHGFNVCQILAIEPQLMIDTMVNDYRRSLNDQFKDAGMKEVL
jgi:transcriptional regulator with XRE-family HTH domain